jgi:hypothetical protein
LPVGLPVGRYHRVGRYPLRQFVGMDLSLVQVAPVGTSFLPYADLTAA